jgi:hypothetical protein
VAAVGALLVTAGCRDMFFPGAALPLPDDDKLIASVFGAQPVGSCGKKEIGCVPGRMLFVSQLWGLMVVSLALAKLATVFSHPEGTLLRRNLFYLFGLSDLLAAFVCFSHESYFNSQGASGMGFVLAFAAEGGVLVADALMRPRPTKKTK